MAMLNNQMVIAVFFAIAPRLFHHLSMLGLLKNPILLLAISPLHLPVRFHCGL